MSEPQLSPATRSLLRAAKTDAPSAAARAKVWSSVASAAGGAAAGAGAVGATGSVSVAPAAASKMLVIGTLLGGTVTVGLAAMLLRVTPVHEGQPPASAPMATLAPAAVRPIAPIVEEPSTAVPAAVTAVAATPRPLVPIAGTAVLPPGPASNPMPVTVRPQPSVDDTLAREAGLLAQAHAALVHGEPRTALRAVRAAQALPSHALGPEELSVEAQALRALGRDGQANDVDSTLKKQFPDSALAH